MLQPMSEPDGAGPAATPEPAAATDADRAERVGEGLKLAFQAMGSADIPDEDRPRWHQRLIAITNSSKHDLATAEARLERYWADWADHVGQPPPGAVAGRAED